MVGQYKANYTKAPRQSVLSKVSKARSTASGFFHSSFALLTEQIKKTIYLKRQDIGKETKHIVLQTLSSSAL